MHDFIVYEPKDINIVRLRHLQKRMQNRKASICSQRAVLYTASFKQSEGEPYILRKAKAFAYTLRNMDIYIEPDSLILEIKQVVILQHQYFLNIQLIG